jgi:hypothetical protein
MTIPAITEHVTIAAMGSNKEIVNAEPISPSPAAEHIIDIENWKDMFSNKFTMSSLTAILSPFIAFRMFVAFLQLFR